MIKFQVKRSYQGAHHKHTLPVLELNNMEESMLAAKRFLRSRDESAVAIIERIEKITVWTNDLVNWQNRTLDLEDE